MLSQRHPMNMELSLPKNMLPALSLWKNMIDR
jgi:hypothetical protein